MVLACSLRKSPFWKEPSTDTNCQGILFSFEHVVGVDVKPIRFQVARVHQRGVVVRAVFLYFLLSFYVLKDILATESQCL